MQVFFVVLFSVLIAPAVAITVTVAVAIPLSQTGNRMVERAADDRQLRVGQTLNAIHNLIAAGKVPPDYRTAISAASASREQGGVSRIT